MSKKNKKKQALEISYPYATFEHMGGDGFYTTIHLPEGARLLCGITTDRAEAHYRAAKAGCKVWLDGEKVKAISSIATSKVKAEVEVLLAREELRREKIAHMKDRPLSEEEVKELPELFRGGAWHLNGIFGWEKANGMVLVYACNYGKNDGVRLVNAPYERPIMGYGGYRDEQPSRLNDDGHF